MCTVLCCPPSPSTATTTSAHPLRFKIFLPDQSVLVVRRFCIQPEAVHARFALRNVVFSPNGHCIAQGLLDTLINTRGVILGWNVSGVRVFVLVVVVVACIRRLSLSRSRSLFLSCFLFVLFFVLFFLFCFADMQKTIRMSGICVGDIRVPCTSSGS